MDAFDHLKGLNTTEIAVAGLFVISGLNYLLPKKVVKKLHLDAIQRFFSFLANTKGGVSPRKEK